MKVTFEVATIADAIKKANRVAPSKGQAFDKAAGIVLTITPDQTPPVVVRATNLDIFHMEWVDALEVEGLGEREWRLPSNLLAQVVSKIPIGSGKTVTFKEVQPEGSNHSHLLIQSGNIKAKFNLMDVTHYPTWDVFDPDELTTATDFGGRIAQVEWAAAQGDVPLCGVYLDGASAIATDKYRLASAPLKVDLEYAVLLPAGILGQILKQTGEVRVGSDGNQFLLMPDDTTQIRCTIFDAEYPRVESVMRREYPEKVTFKKDALLSMIDRASAFAGSDRTPTLRLFIGKQQLAVMMASADIGSLGDILDVPGQCGHERTELKFTPKNLTEALQNAPSDTVTVHYNPTKKGGVLYLDGGSGYECWVMPRAGSV